MGVRQGFSRRSTPAFVTGGLNWEPDPAKPDEGTITVPFGGWSCFHCGDRFTSARAAAKHFGPSVEAPPICVRVGNYVGELREKHVREILRAQVFAAISDPGNQPPHAPQGFKGERSASSTAITASVCHSVKGLAPRRMLTLHRRSPFPVSGLRHGAKSEARRRRDGLSGLRRDGQAEGKRSMIVVRVELWSARDGSRKELARMLLCNQGSTGDLRDYSVEALRGRSTAQLDRREVQRRGQVRGHPSERVHVWNLVAKALQACRYGRE